MREGVCRVEVQREFFGKGLRDKSPQSSGLAGYHLHILEHCYARLLHLLSFTHLRYCFTVRLLASASNSPLHTSASYSN